MMNTGMVRGGRGAEQHLQTEEDVCVMRAIRRIVSKGNNVEIKQTSEGKLKVFEVSKRIARDC